ncbi:hypothetical protein E1301_Tti015307 [Triplophysa tibetana]|uniref:Uncharacterized protein n=1 Tax=Triplophysa tibetana TaxID=1572043 RepID=A0A5A9PUM4_9TELE|nr:hypothetical protein E1301_Tti015307 [Triplophysa tibetana]
MFNTRDGRRARLSVPLLTTLLTIPGDERQTPAFCRQAWPTPPSVIFTAQTNHRGQSQRDAADAHFMNIHGPKRKWIYKQIDGTGCRNGQREFNAWQQSTDETAGTDTLHNPGK